MAAVWVTIMSSALLLVLVNAAYRGQQCPSPCTCIKFFGKQSVYCNSTGITSVPKGIPINTQLLDLSENSITFIDSGPLKYLVNLETLAIYGMGRNDNNVNLADLKLPNLTSIDVSRNDYTSIPQTLPSNIGSMYLADNHIPTIQHDSLRRYPNLYSLDISYTGLSEIQPGALQYSPKLTQLIISFNNLTDDSFPPNVFSNNRALELVSMRFNKLEHTLPGLPASVKHLDYVGNKIKTLKSYAFKSTPRLQTMEFWQGQVTTIEDNAFYGLSKLSILDFMQDTIASPITNLTFNGLSGLQTIYLDINNISSVDIGALQPLESLTSLWMSGNQLSHLQPGVLDEAYVAHLSELYIDFNPWYCDCNLRWLRERMDNATYVIQDPHLVKCAGPTKLAGKAWDQLKPSDFVCV